MSFLPNENTLGVTIVPKGARASVRRGLRAVENQHRASLGMAFIGGGAALVAALSAIYNFSWFVALWSTYENPVPALVSWILMITALVGAFVVGRVVGDHLPDFALVIFFTLIAASFLLDLLAIWSHHDIGGYATTALTAGMALLAIVSTRGEVEVLIADGIIGAALLAAILVNTDLSTANPSQQITSFGFTVLPAVLGVLVVHGFRRMVQIELDRALVQSTVNAPRFAVGMLASEELARLDLAAEELLESVATGKTPLPLRPRTASVAASLATELRLHLIEGRRETWLYHAVTESEMLGKSVTLSDRGSLAGLLDDGQRDGLLSAIWMLVSEKSKPSATRTVQLQVGPIAPTATTAVGQKLVVPIGITSTGIARNKVDASTWEALRRVGRYSDSTRDASVKIDIECLVDNPADL